MNKMLIFISFLSFTCFLHGDSTFIPLVVEQQSMVNTAIDLNDKKSEIFVNDIAAKKNSVAKVHKAHKRNTALFYGSAAVATGAYVIAKCAHIQDKLSINDRYFAIARQAMIQEQMAAEQVTVSFLSKLGTSIKNGALLAGGTVITKYAYSVLYDNIAYLKDVATGSFSLACALSKMHNNHNAYIRISKALLSIENVLHAFAADKEPQFGVEGWFFISGYTHSVKMHMSNLLIEVDTQDKKDEALRFLAIAEKSFTDLLDVTVSIGGYMEYQNEQLATVTLQNTFDILAVKESIAAFVKGVSYHTQEVQKAINAYKKVIQSSCSIEECAEKKSALVVAVQSFEIMVKQEVINFESIQDKLQSGNVSLGLLANIL